MEMNQHDTQQPWVLTFKNTASEGGGNDVCSLFNLLVFRVLSQEMEDLGAMSSYAIRGLVSTFPSFQRSGQTTRLQTMLQ